jgi:hypothetical protein
MICPTCRYNKPPGFIRKGAALEPCPDCGGAVDASLKADAADERRYQQLATQQPEEGGDVTLH